MLKPDSLKIINEKVLQPIPGVEMINFCQGSHCTFKLQPTAETTTFNSTQQWLISWLTSNAQASRILATNLSNNSLSYSFPQHETPRPIFALAGFNDEGNITSLEIDMGLIQPNKTVKLHRQLAQLRNHFYLHTQGYLCVSGHLALCTSMDCAILTMERYIASCPPAGSKDLQLIASLSAHRIIAIGNDGMPLYPYCLNMS